MIKSRHIVTGFIGIILVILPILTNNSNATESTTTANNVESTTTITENKVVEVKSVKTTTNKNFVTHCTVTCYNPVEAQCNSQPLITADMSKINMSKLKAGKIKWCAVSRDLLPYLPYGSKILIEGEGVYEVHDTMNKRFNHYIDILQHPSEQGFKKTNIKITQLG